MRASRVLLPILFAPSFLSAQRDSLPAFNSLRTPPSPAFVLLGVEPTSVARPNTPSELAISVLNSTNQLASLPRDFALEVSPYWLFAHPTLSWRDDTTRTPQQSALRTGTISVATAQRGTSARPVTGVSVAARLSLVSGSVSKRSRATLVRLEDTLGVLAKTRADIESGLRAAADNEFINALGEAVGKSDSIKRREEAAARHERAIALVDLAASKDPRYTAAKSAIETEFQDFAVQREGPSIEFAGGAIWDAPNQIIDSARFTGWGAWLTLSYQGAHWSIVGVGRYLAVDTTGGFNTLDAGVRVIHTSRLLAASIEYVDRHFLGSGAPGHRYRLVGVFDYQLEPGIWLSGTFGRGYDTKAPGGLIVQLGLSFEFNGKRYKVP